MNTATENDFRPPRIALFVLALMCVALTANAHNYKSYAFYTALCCAIAYIGWRFHGILVAALGVLLAFVHLESAQDRVELFEACSSLVLIAGSIMAWSVAHRRGRWAWLVPTTVIGFGTSLMLLQQTNPLAEADIRLMQANLVLLSIAGIAGSMWFARTVGTVQTLLLFGSTLAIPTLLIFGVHYSGALSTELVHLNAWRARVPQWTEWAKHVFTQSEPWCWASAWMIIPLMLLGWWQAWTRGRKQRQQGEAPVGWLFGIGMTLGFVAVLPSEHLLLHLETILLPLFGVADLSLSLVERIQLTPPPTEPTDTPRVV